MMTGTGELSNADIVVKWALSRVGCPYIMGGTGQPCTVAYRRARAEQYPDSAAKIRQYCPRMSSQATSCAECRYYDAAARTGKPAYDCAQLTRGAMKQIGLSLVSGSNSQWQRTDCAARGDIADMPGGTVCLVFRLDKDGRMGHVGCCLGDGTVVHARGHAYGVVREAIRNTGFTHFMTLRALSDPLQSEVIRMDVKRGDKGDGVREVQKALMAAGYGLPKYGADGDFGAETEAAVKAAQRDAGLMENGVAQAGLWQYLTGEDGDAEEAPEQQEAPDEGGEAEEVLARIYDELKVYFKEV